MLNIKKENDLLHVKGSKFYYCMLAVFLIGGVIGCAYLLIEGARFNSAYSIIWLAGGFVFFLSFFIYLFGVCQVFFRERS